MPRPRSSLSQVSEESFEPRRESGLKFVHWFQFFSKVDRFASVEFSDDFNVDENATVSFLELVSYMEDGLSMADDPPNIIRQSFRFRRYWIPTAFLLKRWEL